jgi:hypothetical protein
MSTMPEQNLWRSVVTQAVRDAFSKDEYYRWRAWVWFYNGSSDYCQVCELAGISADRLRQTMIETIFFNYLTLKGGITMQPNKPFKKKILKDKKRKMLASDNKVEKSLNKQFDTARRAKSIFSAIYSQQELDKAIGNLTLQDIINICKQSEAELDAEAILEANND